MRVARAHPRLLLALLACARAADTHTDAPHAHTARDQARAGYTITDAEFYEMPQLFRLDEYSGCVARAHVYCVGSFELGPATTRAQPLYHRMQAYSANWVDHFNHTRLHRGLCLQRSCAGVRPPPATPGPPGPHTDHHQLTDARGLEEWFSTCVNASTMSEHELWARLYRLEYCTASGAASDPPLSGSERAFAAVLAAVVALVALGTALDLALPDHTKKGVEWALSFSVVGCWRELQAPVRGGAGGGETDLRSLDGLRVLCMMCVIIEHVCWLTTQVYIENIREYETMRRDADVILMTNSTLVVQVFFLMSSFLLAHKLLQQRRRHDDRNAPSAFYTFFDTMWNRIIRVSPSYWAVVWFAASWWGRLGRGPLWEPFVGAEAAVCRRKWWTHLLYLNNVLYPDDKCLIQTWYLAADMQLYALSLALTLVLVRARRGEGGCVALLVLAALFGGTVALLAGLAYAWRLFPTFVMHNPELVRAVYTGEASFNVLYQSPLSNSPGALMGLLLAFTHHELLARRVTLNQYKWFRWVSVVAPGAAVWWAAASPLLLSAGPPARAPAAILAAVERPVFSFFVALGLLGAMHDVESPLRTLFSWRGWQAPARLSFSVLLLHMPLNKSLVANRLVASQMNRQVVIFEWFGVALVTYACAVPLAMCVEYPAQRLHRALRSLVSRRAAPPHTAHTAPTPAPAHTAPAEKSDAD